MRRLLSLSSLFVDIDSDDSLDVIQVDEERVLRGRVVRVVGRDDVSDELLPEDFPPRGSAVADRRAEDPRADLLERFLVF